MEGIKSVLSAKLEAIHKTIHGLDLTAQITRVRDWHSDLFAAGGALNRQAHRRKSWDPRKGTKTTSPVGASLKGHQNLNSSQT